MTVRNRVSYEEAAKAAHVHVRLARNGLDEGWLDYVEHHLTAADNLMGLANGLDSPVSPSREKELEDVGDVYLLLDEAKKDVTEEEVLKHFRQMFRDEFGIDPVEEDVSKFQEAVQKAIEYLENLEKDE